MNPQKGTPQRKRRLWKTFYFEDGSAVGRLQSCWQSFGDKKPHHRMYFEHAAIETNLPESDCRTLFRWADVKWVDYVSDTKPSLDEEGEAS